MWRTYPIAVLLFLLTSAIYSQSRYPGIITGRIADSKTGAPVEYANILIRTAGKDSLITGGVSDSTGAFRIGDIPYGRYVAEFSFIGYEKKRTGSVIVEKKRSRVDLGTLILAPSMVAMDEVTVTAEKSMMISKIDRKVFNVQKDIQAQTGTVSDLLQNIPSVSVDMDGNVSLRGSGSVMILFNGRPSLMTGAANLEQMPASLVEKIEVITNPSAKYRPDGTGGIINIILKKEKKAGFNGTVGFNAGNHDRFNTNLQMNLHTGPVNLFGSYGFRQDYRSRSGSLESETIDTSLNTSVRLNQGVSGYSRTRSHLGQIGLDWDIGKKDAAGITALVDYRLSKRHDTTSNLYLDDAGITKEDYTRDHDGKEHETGVELTAFYEHVFEKEKDHRIRAGFEYKSDRETENDGYRNGYRYPVQPVGRDSTTANNGEQNITATLEYSRPLWQSGSLEAGYEGTFQITDQRQDVLHQESSTGSWVASEDENNRYNSTQAVHAFYVTTAWNLRKFKVMAGLRAEEALLDLDFIALDTSANTSYFRLYPTVHLGYSVGSDEIQLNYSRRVNRPDGEDMNPKPEYRDPRNIFAGNPDLKPEDIHSLELGYFRRSDHVTMVPTLFYRYKVNGFSMVTRSVNDSVLLTTFDNVATDQSAGLDFSGTAQIAKIINLNFSASGFWSRIDASNIGYGSRSSTFAWSAKLNASFTPAKNTLIQVNCQYRSEVLTAQGYRKPSWVVNLGFRQDLLKKKLSLIATVSDLFNTQVMKHSIHTGILVQESVRRRDARVIYAGVVFNFGANGKKQKESKFEFDNGMDR